MTIRGDSLVWRGWRRYLQVRVHLRVHGGSHAILVIRRHKEGEYLSRSGLVRWLPSSRRPCYNFIADYIL